MLKHWFDKFTKIKNFSFNYRTNLYFKIFSSFIIVLLLICLKFAQRDDELLTDDIYNRGSYRLRSSYPDK